MERPACDDAGAVLDVVRRDAMSSLSICHRAPAPFPPRKLRTPTSAPDIILTLTHSTNSDLYNLTLTPNPKLA